MNRAPTLKLKKSNWQTMRKDCTNTFENFVSVRTKLIYYASSRVLQAIEKNNSLQILVEIRKKVNVEKSYVTKNNWKIVKASLVEKDMFNSDFILSGMVMFPSFLTFFCHWFVYCKRLLFSCPESGEGEMFYHFFKWFLPKYSPKVT